MAKSYRDFTEHQVNSLFFSVKFTERQDGSSLRSSIGYSLNHPDHSGPAGVASILIDRWPCSFSNTVPQRMRRFFVSPDCGSLYSPTVARSFPTGFILVIFQGSSMSPPRMFQSRCIYQGNLSTFQGHAGESSAPLTER